MGRFDDRATRPQRGPGDMLRWRILDTLAGRRVKDPGGFVTPVRENDGALLAAPRPSLTWIGHASFVARLGGKLLAVDPIWSSSIAVVRRSAPPGVALEKVPPLDLVAITHNHYDHLDLPTLKRIGAAPTYVVPLGLGEMIAKLGFRVVELDWWQSHVEGALTVTLVPARHWSMRHPWNRNDTLWGGYVFSSSDGVAYHAGDTALFDGFAEIASRLGPIDWAMLPIGAYEPRWFMEPQHMNPEDAVEAFLALRARTLVAMHWGTFKLTDEPLGEPPERIRRAFAERQIDPSRLWVLDVGETRLLER
jgi:L-ascorbate metabolism protein UlaG (beta-lactamase superfamily)